MNVDTDTQFAYLVGMRVCGPFYKQSSTMALFGERSVLTVVSIQDYFEKKKGYLKAQVGNPEGEDQPNKKVQMSRGGVQEVEADHFGY